MAKNFLKTRKARGTSEVRRRKQKKKNKSASEGSKSTENEDMKLNLSGKDQQKDATVSTEHVEKNQQSQKKEENTGASGSKEKHSKSNDCPKKRRRGEEPGLSNKNGKNGEKWKGKKQRKQNQQIVRFGIHADCFPLAESIFKKAIKENYNEKNKFKTELTSRQVQKLTELFRPVAVHSTALHVQSPNREASARDAYANISARSHHVLSHEMDRQTAYGELASSRREEIHRDLYLSEKEYRAYGLQGARSNVILQHNRTPILGSYDRDYREQPLLQPETVYRDTSTVYAATASTSVAAASSYGSYSGDPYYTHYHGASFVDSYPQHPIGEAHQIETDHLRRIEGNQMDRLYSTYASDALADYNQMHLNQDVKPEVAPTSVPSQYSFAGASLSYR
ncbi:hypothetical protein PTKIN_Ptkin06aG0158500 [Pterospermum kingtungense]